MRSTVNRLASLLLICLIAGCVAKEVLQPKSAAVPAGVNLSGQWQLRAESRDEARLLEEAGLGEPGDVIADAKRARTGRSAKAPSDTAVRVFLEVGNALKVTQTEHGIFVSFDRSVVEEYRFGENRQINVGPIVAARVSGWEGDSYVIETLDEEGSKLVERYRLANNGQTLVREVFLSMRGGEQLDLSQLYDRR